jgi:hypothetical protein
MAGCIAGYVSVTSPIKFSNLEAQTFISAEIFQVSLCSLGEKGRREGENERALL